MNAPRRALRAAGTWLVLLACATGPPGAAWAAGFDAPSSSDPSQQFGPPFDGNVQRQDTPNDPDYDHAESDDPDTPPAARSSNLFDERFDLFGFPSEKTRLTARYTEGPSAPRPQVSGFNAAGAWKVTRGDPDVSVAILDTGVNWDDAGVRDRVALNVDELPAPRGGGGPASPSHDRDGDGAVSVDDYAADPRVVAVIGGGRPPTGQDLIRAFSDGSDDDGNGYVDDIAGWDFFDDDNDPADTSSYFAAENHGSGRTSEAVEKGNDGSGSIGVCPKCQYVPLRVWDTFVSDQNNFFMAVVYATDNGVEVIEGANGGLYHSAFAEQASEYAYDHGVSQVYSGDDLNTANHNYPANYDHTMLIQGTVADSKGLGMDLPADDRDPGLRAALLEAAGRAMVGTSVPVGTYFRGANTTQFGGHSSISMEGSTGSTNTGKAAGAAALVISAARRGSPATDLSADETRALLEQTAEDVLPGNTAGTGNPDPSQPGFDTHFGYGRANVGEAVRAASQGKIPPEAAIDSPDWYAPLAGDRVAITGLARARATIAGGAFSWRLEYGLGLAPTSFTTVAQGSSAGRAVRAFGTLPLDEVRQALAAREALGHHPDRDDPGGPVLDPAPGEDPFQGQFTVRLVVTSADGSVLPGIDRKVLTALDDPTLRANFPKRLGTGGEAPLRYADLNGDNVQELVLPTQDGRVHAYRRDGSELPGWPVRTRIQFSAASHLKSRALKALHPPREPPRGPTIADLTGDGLPEVITAAGERLYAWDSAGRRLPGWPVRPDRDRSNCALSEQRKELSHPKCGFLATPAVGRLEGPGKALDVVAPALDGRLYAYRADGSAVPGFPVRLIDTAIAADRRMTAESINNPAVGDLNGDGRDDVIVPTNEVYGAAGGGGGDVSFAGALGGAVGTTSRVYAVDSRGRSAPGGRPFLDGWPIELPGVIQDVLPLIGPGHDPALVKLDGAQQVVVSTTGGALALYDARGVKTREINQNAAGEGALNLFESAAVGDVNGNGPEIVKYQIDLNQAVNLLLVGQNVPYSHRIGVFDASTGQTAPGYPVVTDDYQFLSSSTVARVGAGAANHVVAGTGLGLLHAYDGITGRDAPGFPKVTGGWLFAPAALSDDRRAAAITREGFLFEWNVPDTPACQSEWPSFRHDQQGTGNYDADGTPPGAPDRLSLTRLAGRSFRLVFRSPGDDGLCGTAARYLADVDGRPLALGDPVAGGTTLTRTVELPRGPRRVTIRAADAAAGRPSNLGAPGILRRQASGGFAPVPAQPVRGGSGTPVPGGGPGGLGPGGCTNLKTGTRRGDRLRGTAGRDRILGLLGRDMLRGGRGSDCLFGGGGRDLLLGERGSDLLSGGSGRDRLSGQGGADVLRGGGGRDLLVGGPARDRFLGGSGRDLIDAIGGGRERIKCGGGRDVVRADRGDRVSGCERIRRPR